MTAPNTHPARPSRDSNRITSGGSVTYSLRKLLDEVASDDGVDPDTREQAMKHMNKIPAKRPKGLNKSRRWLLEE